MVQGRNLQINVSHNKRNNRLGGRCIKGCKFKICTSWDSRREVFVVKSVNNHTCHRNMMVNRQLKAQWIGMQFLPIFKSKPHWPAKEIIDVVKVCSLLSSISISFIFMVQLIDRKHISNHTVF